MKRTILIAAVVAISPSLALAQGDWRKTCDPLGGLAEEIMSARQAGMSMAKSMEIVKDVALHEKMVIAAYEVPRYSTAKQQKREVEEFRDTWYLACVKKFKK